MKNFFLVILSLGSLIFFTQCSDEEDGGDENWAAAVEGNYVGSASICTDTFNTIVANLTRLDDKKISLDISFDGETHCLNKIFLNSSTTFTIAEFDSCFSETAIGSGNFAGNAVSFSLDYSSSQNYFCIRHFDGTK